MDGFIQTLRKLGTVRLLAMGGVAIGLLVFFIFLSSRLNTSDMSLLYGELETSDSAQIVAKLESLGVPFELSEKGKQILVPTSRVGGLRMLMAEEGLPSGGSVGYDIFDRSETLGMTNFVQNVNLLRAIEGELARSIKSLSQVKDARVHLVLPKRELFSRNKHEPSASVILKTGGNSQLDKTKVLAIQHLVSAAVPNLKPNRISIVDQKGRLLARAGERGDVGLVAAETEEFRINKEQQLTSTIEGLLELSVGPGKVRAQVSAEMDFDHVTTNSESYDPDGRVVRSTQTVEETSNSSDQEGTSSVSVANNLPDSNSGGGAGGSSSRGDRTEETVNYEISKTVTRHIRESGLIRRLSVAVLVDGVYETPKDGKQVYKPRTKTELDQLAALVRSAIGFDKRRGDTLEIVNMRFARSKDTSLEQTTPLFGLNKSDYFRIAEIFVLAIVGILVILLVVRPLITRTLDALPAVLDPMPETNLLSDQSQGTPAIAGPEGAGVSGPTEDAEEVIDIDAVDGRVRRSTLKKVGGIVDRHPDETVSIIRQWMYQDA